MNTESHTMYKTVMIIDDTYVDRYISERNIKKYHFAEEVISMASADAAIRYLSNIQNTVDVPELIFLDIRMPEVDGFGFLDKFEKLSATIRNRSSIVILSTSLNPCDHARVNHHTLVVGFINKPLNEEKLLNLNTIRPIGLKDK